MTDEPSTPNEHSLPIERSRRTLLRLLGSATAVGAMSGVAAAGGDDTDDHEDCGCPTDPGTKLQDAFHIHGIELTNGELHVDSMRARPELSGTRYEVLACDGLAAHVEDDELTHLEVDDVSMHHLLERKVEEMLDHLANGHVPDGMDDMPEAVEEFLLDVNENHYRHIKKSCADGHGVAHALESRIDGADGALPGLLLFEALLIIILVLVVVFLFLGGGLAGF